MTDMPGDGLPKPVTAAPVQMCPTGASTACQCGAALTRDPRFDAQRQKGMR